MDYDLQQPVVVRPSPEYIEELALIRISQMERSVLERWSGVCALAGEHDQATLLANIAVAKDNG